MRINQVYQEYISDKTHLHMNATRWMSLTEFAKHLGRTGVCHVDENEKGVFVAWVDNSPKALSKAEANQKKERGDMDDETRQRKLIEEQIERARKDGERRRVEAAGGVWDGGDTEGTRAPVEEIKRELVREEGEKVSLSLSFKVKPAVATGTTSPPSTAFPTIKSEADDSPLPTAATTTAPTSTFIAPRPSAVLAFQPKPNAFKMAANPLKRPNPLKPNPLKSGSSTTSVTKRPAAAMSAVESIALEEMKRKERNGGQAWQGGEGLNKKPRY